MTVVEERSPIAPEDGLLSTAFDVPAGSYAVRWHLSPGVVREGTILVPEGEDAVRFDL